MPPVLVAANASSSRAPRATPKSVTTTHGVPPAALGRGDQKHVLALEVAVHDAGGVRRPSAAAIWRTSGRASSTSIAPLAPQPGGERLALEQLHGEEDHRPAGREVVEADVEDAADVGVGDPARQVDLTLEALDRAGLAGVLRVDGLESQPLAQLEVLGLVDLAHAAAGDEADDPVAPADELARRENRGGGVEPVRLSVAGTRSAEPRS